MHFSKKNNDQIYTLHKKLNRKIISAFTILEVVITMIISSIVIVLAYTLLNTIQNEWQKITKNQTKVTELAVFKHTFDNDIDKCDYIKFIDPHTYIFKFTDDSTVYVFGKKIVRKSKLSVDTFEIEFDSVIPHYLKQIHVGNIIDSINMAISSPVSIKKVVFEKRYSSSDLINFHQKDSL